LIDSVKGGSPVLIVDRGRPVARLEPVSGVPADDDSRLARLVRDGVVRPARAYIVEVRKDVLEEKNGPMLIHGLKGFHGTSLLVPLRQASQPDRNLLEERYTRFRRLAG
jgi:antitoxin (DNA-binding transcriptional repressor) of toxin-antitoxin stability system